MLISHSSIKGIAKSIRKLTHDLIQSETSTVLNDTDCISVGKDSPAFSGEKKYRPTGKASQVISLIPSDEIFKAKCIYGKQLSQDYDRLYHSNNDQKNPSFL